MGCAPSSSNTRSRRSGKDAPPITQDERLIDVVAVGTSQTDGGGTLRESNGDARSSSQNDSSSSLSRKPDGAYTGSAGSVSRLSGSQVAPHQKKKVAGPAAGIDADNPNSSTSSRNSDAEKADESAVFSFGEFSVARVDELLSRDDISGFDRSVTVVPSLSKKKIRDSDDYHQLLSLRLRTVSVGSPSRVKSLAICGFLLVSACTEDNTAGVHHLNMQLEVGRLSLHTNVVTHITASQGGQLLATASRDGFVSVWDPSTLRRLWKLVFEFPITSLAFSPEAAFLGISTQDKICRVWSMKAGRMLRAYNFHRATITASKITNNPYYLVTGSIDRTVRIQELMAAEPTIVFTRHPNPIISLDLLETSPRISSKANGKENGNGEHMKIPDEDGLPKNPVAEPKEQEASAALPEAPISSGPISFRVLSADFTRAFVWNGADGTVLHAVDMSMLQTPSRSVLMEPAILQNQLPVSCISAVFFPPPFTAYIAVATNTKAMWIIQLDGKEPPAPVLSRGVLTALTRADNIIVAGDAHGNLSHLLFH